MDPADKTKASLFSSGLIGLLASSFGLLLGPTGCGMVLDIHDTHVSPDVGAGEDGGGLFSGPAAFVAAGQDSFKESATTATALIPMQAEGDLNVVFIGWFRQNGTVASVTDLAGNTYVEAITTSNMQPTDSKVTQSVYYAPHIAAPSQNNAITVVMNGPVYALDVRVASYTNVSTLVRVMPQSGNSTPATATVTSEAGTKVIVLGACTASSFDRANPQPFTLRGMITPDGDFEADLFPGEPNEYSISLDEGIDYAWLLHWAAFR